MMMQYASRKESHNHQTSSEPSIQALASKEQVIHKVVQGEGILTMESWRQVNMGALIGLSLWDATVVDGQGYTAVVEDIVEKMGPGTTVPRGRFRLVAPACRIPRVARAASV